MAGLHARRAPAGTRLGRLCLLILIASLLAALPAAAQILSFPQDVCPPDLRIEGVAVSGVLPIEQARGHEDYVLQVHILRMRAADAPPPDLLGSRQGVRYVDMMLVFHQPEEAIRNELLPWMLQLRDLGPLEAQYSCAVTRPDTFLLHDPFVAVDGDTVTIARTVLAFRRDAGGDVVSGAFARQAPGEDLIGALLQDFATPMPDAVGQDQPDQGRVWRRNYYAWIPDFDFAATETGEAVFALDRIDCDPGGNFLVGSVGAIAAPEDGPPTGRLAVERQSMLAANAYYGVSGHPDDEGAVAASVNESAYWCIPKREFCHQQIDFGDFGVRARQGEISEFEETDVVSMRHGLVMAMQRLIMDRCPQTEIEAGVK